MVPLVSSLKTLSTGNHRYWKLKKGKLSSGSTEEASEFLIEIWSDDIMKHQLQMAHKNADTFQVFLRRMRGYERTGEQRRSLIFLHSFKQKQRKILVLAGIIAM